MVTTVLPSTAEAWVWHARTATPSRCTVQAPHRPAPQPYLVPVKPTWSRMTHRSGGDGSASTVTRLAFNVNETMLPPSALARGLRRLPASKNPVARARHGGPAKPGGHLRCRQSSKLELVLI